MSVEGNAAKETMFKVEMGGSSQKCQMTQ